MRIDLDGTDQIALHAAADEVHDVLARPDEVLAMLDGMLHPSSTPDRWVMADAHAGPIVLTPAVDVTIDREAHGVTVSGAPVSGHTPARIDITLTVQGDAGGATVSSAWRLTVDVPGPQLLATTIRPLVAASARSTTRRIGNRLRRRFDTPPV